MRHCWLFLMFFLLGQMTPTFAYADEMPLSQRQDVQSFIHYMVKRHHFKTEQLTALFNATHFLPPVVGRLNKPYEKEKWDTYQMLFVTKWRIQRGLAFWNQYHAALSKAEQMYGVPAGIIVATIGIETKYGEKTGDYRVIDALSTLAFSPLHRAAYFRHELEEFLLLTREEHLDPFKVLGSYAGAIGQPQFMPSSYRRYAVNFSKSGKIDLMYNVEDIIGSIANYYAKHGWIRHAPVAAPAALISSRRAYFANLNDSENHALSISDLHKIGLTPAAPFPFSPSEKVKVVELQSHYNKEYWLGFHNFDVIKRYNSSDLYAMAVYQLSHFITNLREKTIDAT